MAFRRYNKKYQMDKKQAEAALQDILAASGQDDIERRSRRAFQQQDDRRRSRWQLWALAAALTAALTAVCLALWQH